MINGSSKLFGVLGHPVAHSLSPAMHNAAFQARGINAVYLPLDATDLATAFAGLKALSFVGISVTVPHKVAIIPFLDAIEPVAQKIGAVNTLLFHHDVNDANGKLLCTGENTDWLGANQALAEVIDLAGSSVLVLGAGGAARAIGFGLQEAGAQIFLHNRSEERGRLLAAELGCSFVDTTEVKHVQADVLVNATSAGMEPEVNIIPLEAELLAHFQVVMDIVYAPLQTRLLSEAAARGCKTVPGTQMLLYQATAQWRLWLGEEPPTEVMRAALNEALAGKRKKAK
ncbi:MAG: shikimate dehydrogenase [Desulfobulbus sp.]|jgi:shikimate dehydrogenase